MKKGPANYINLLVIVLSAGILLLHAREFDFICDDAFISLRYAEYLSKYGSPVYNIGEHVEGYTNFLWMVLSAFLFKIGLSAESVVVVLGASSSLLLMFGIERLWSLASRYNRAISWFPMMAVAATAPVAAWTLSGLETTLYAALITLGCACGVAVAVRPGRRYAFSAGIIFALATLTRPEGLVPMAIGVMLVLINRRTEGLRDVIAWFAGFALLFLPFFFWRWEYYGYPLPNTYYLKTSGNADELRERGIRYVVLAAKDFGVVTPFIFMGLFAPCSKQGADESLLNFRARKVLSWALRLNVLALIPYIVSVGGDFLGLYRFLVPIIPFAWVAFTLGCCHLVDRLPPLPWMRRAAVGLGLLSLAAYTSDQIALGQFARTHTNPEQQAAGIEPIHWTRLYARKWGAMGRWIAERARLDDRMAVGAAGAMPYYAGIFNIDILGLCDSEVAHHGIVVGSRPGHQRRARLEYTLSKKPVFLFENDYDSEMPARLRYDPAWDRRGYLWVEAQILQSQHKAPSTFYYYFLMRKDRALELQGTNGIKVATSGI